jgi:hypothetical protein
MGLEEGLVRYRSDHPAAAVAALRGTLRELVLVRVAVEWRSLEDLLETLARAPFPVNPEIQHGNPATTVEFPAYESDLTEIRKLLAAAGLGECRIQVASMLSALR